MNFIRTAVAALCLVCLPAQALAEGYAVRIGPPATGQGGPNPITFSPIELQLQYVTDGWTEYQLSLTGLTAGKRHRFSNGLYVSAGGGLIISGNGGGIGAYTAFGADLYCGRMCWSTEYIQAISLFQPITSPSAIRTGVSAWF